jgi:DNA-binding beta-propeller fold protein YncE
MKMRRLLAGGAALAGGLLAAFLPPLGAAGAERRLLYVASPGIRNYVEYGGVGLLVFDIASGHRFVKRIPTFPVELGKEPENVKGIVASARTGLLYLSTPQRLAAFDLVTERMVWSRTYEGGCDRMAISPDGKVLYVPSFEGPHWTVVDGKTGDVIEKVVTNSGAHNTIYGPGGRLAYLAGLKSPMLNVADGARRRVVKQVGPFGNAIRPFTVNGSETLVFVNVNALLGFEVGDLQTGRLLHRVEVDGYAQGPVKRHGCPSHGVALTPDEKELWLADGANNSVHVFDATVMPPRQAASIRLRDQPGWVTFGIDGQYAYPSTGEVVDTRTRKIVATLADETGRAVQSEKLLEIVFSGGRPVRAGDQFGLGGRR